LFFEPLQFLNFRSVGWQLGPGVQSEAAARFVADFSHRVFSFSLLLLISMIWRSEFALSIQLQIVSLGLWSMDRVPQNEGFGLFLRPVVKNIIKL
jgi:hypothetical protein